MNTCHIYMICNKKGKVLFVMQYKFNVVVSSPLAYINTNYTLLALSSSNIVKVRDSITDTNLKPAMEADATSHKKMYTEILYTLNLHLNINLDILKKNGKISQKI